jgi:threonine aldolase
VDPPQVRTNLVLLDLRKTAFDGPGLAAAARERGVLTGAVGPWTLRLITHLDVDDAGVDRAIDVLTGLLA